MQSALTEGVCLVSCSSLPKVQRSVVLSYPSIHTIPKALIHPDRHNVRAPHVKIHEEASISRIGYELEQIHHLTRDPETTVFRCDRDGRNMAVPFGWDALC